jgi:DNA-binding PadR family transcriptional regulator
MAKSPSPAPSLPPHWFQILLSLADRDLHGLAIMNDVLERTGGRMRLWPAMLYRNLARLVSEELVSEIDAPPDVDPRGGRPRFYRITALGRRACAEEAQRLAGFVDVARRKKVIKA